ncbi:hypothetical protein MMC11_001593 [Xylographa trunciseda]|nr:hypothetical protein [Xylographa trunciseda]
MFHWYASSIALCLVGSVVASPFPTLSPRDETLADCLSSSNVPVSNSSSSDFAQLSEPYNLRLAYVPVVIVLPTTPQHVSDAVVCAAASDVKVQAKSGGHSYASFSSGGENGAMMIDLENFQDISVDDSGVATVGAGVRLGNLALGIYNSAQRALPHGTCPGVGVGGHFTHGGYGYDSRLWGLALDTIVALDVVLANGSFIQATSTTYPDIFYALRGAAESFGVVTHFYLQTQPAPSSLVYWHYGFPNMYASSETMTSTILHWQDFALNSTVVDQNIGFGVHIDGSDFSISGIYFGSIDDFNNLIVPELLRSIPAPNYEQVQDVDWITALEYQATGGSASTLSEPLTGYNAHDDFFAKSLVTPESDPLTSDALTSYFDYIIANGVGAPNPWFSIINLYGGAGSAINTQDPSSSAYADRSSLWVFQHYAYTGNSGAAFPSAIQPFVTGLNDAIPNAQPQTTFTAYLNYVDPSYTAAEAHSLYYGDAVYARLLALKQVYDPGMVFWNPQAIGA